ncbi:MAG: diguanylate cyclase [Bryobacteraceae bacterium]
MISLKKSLDEIGRYNDLFRAALECFIAALRDTEEHALPVHRELWSRHQNRLQNLRTGIPEQPSPADLYGASLALSTELKRYSEESAGHLSRREEDFREILVLLAKAAGEMNANANACGLQFQNFAKKLEDLSRCDDLHQIRQGLRVEVGAMRDSAQTVQSENRAAVSRMEAELRGLQARLRQVEELAATDALTNIPNRREGERLLAQRIADGDPFSIVVIDLDYFKKVNDKWGHLCGDEVLRIFAKSLQTQLAARDVVCRWGGDEFLAILSCPLEQAEARASQMVERCGGEYLIPLRLREIKVLVAASAGVAAHQPGESCEHLVARADEILYNQKNERALSMGKQSA